jgi:4-hydroxy-3-methylbut-2-enyl diphosphate reductase
VIKIILSQPIGFCSGVKRAIKLVKKATKTYKEVITFGPLIHNESVLKELESLGIRYVNSLKELKKLKSSPKSSSVVVIRTHGLALDLKASIESLGYPIIDATCPTVKRVSEYVRKYTQEGYSVVIIGDAQHPEVRGILGHSAHPEAIKVYERTLPQKLKLMRVKKLLLLAQTTITAQEFFRPIQEFLVRDFQEIRIINTLCPEAQARQNSCQTLKKLVKLVIVVGERQSANTKSLYQILAAEQKPVIWIKSPGELKRNDILRGFLKKPSLSLGIVSGASVPATLVYEVIEALKTLFKTSQNNKCQIFSQGGYSDNE